MGDVIVNLLEQIRTETKNSAASHAARMITIDRLAKQALEAREAECNKPAAKPVLGAAADLAPASPEANTGVAKAGNPVQAPHPAAAQPVAAKPVVQNPASGAKGGA